MARPVPMAGGNGQAAAYTASDCYAQVSQDQNTGMRRDVRLSLQEQLKLIDSILLLRRHRQIAVGSVHSPGLCDANLVLRSPENTTGGSLLLEHLLLMGV
jgi:hypothetical protein